MDLGELADELASSGARASTSPAAGSAPAAAGSGSCSSGSRRSAVYLYYRIATSNPIRLRPAAACRRAQMEIFLPLGLIVAARRRDRRADDGGRQVAARALRPERDRRHDGRRRRHRPGHATRSSTRSTCSSATRRSASRWAATRARRSCSKARPAPARRTWPRRWRAKPACRSCSCRRPRSSRCTTAQTGRKIRNYFKELRKAAREEGGAIGFIEEIDAIAGARSGMRSDAARRRGLHDRDGRSSAARRARASRASSTSC